MITYDEKRWLAIAFGAQIICGFIALAFGFVGMPVHGMLLAVVVPYLMILNGLFNLGYGLAFTLMEKLVK